MNSTEATWIALATARWPQHDWGAATVLGGAFHAVVLPAQGPVLRITTGRDAADRAQREAQILRVLVKVNLPLPAPRVLDGPTRLDGWVATLITRVPGHQDEKDRPSGGEAIAAQVGLAGGRGAGRAAGWQPAAAPLLVWG